MLNMNFYKAMGANMSGGTAAFTAVSVTGEEVSVTGSGIVSFLSSIASKVIHKTIYTNGTTTSSASNGFFLCSNGDDPTVEDYSIPSADYITEVSHRSGAGATYHIEGNTLKIESVLTAAVDTNTAAQTIRSVYLYSGSNGKIIIDHTLLDAPVVVQPGETKYIKHTITIPIS